MPSSIPLADDEAEAALAIVADALRRLEPQADAKQIIAKALEKAAASEIPREHGGFHAFASGPLYDVFSSTFGVDRADILMGDVNRMWRSVSLHQRDARSAAPPRGDELHGITVLVVDDDALALRALARALPDFGAEVHKATDSRSAMSFIHSRPPDVIVADYDMPGESGATLASRLLLAMGSHAPPVICLTGVLPLPDSQSFHAVLSKPTHPSQLVAAILDAHDSKQRA
jgi:CheY-like chemotaxis protein